MCQPCLHSDSLNRCLIEGKPEIGEGDLRTLQVHQHGMSSGIGASSILTGTIVNSHNLLSIYYQRKTFAIYEYFEGIHTSMSLSLVKVFAKCEMPELCPGADGRPDAIVVLPELVLTTFGIEHFKTIEGCYHLAILVL